MQPISDKMLASTSNKHKQVTGRKLDMELLFLQFVGIIAVVMGHYYGVPNAFNSIFPFYSWHMPYFILISGILFGRQLTSKRHPGKYFIKKIRSLLLPALFVNLCYGIISMVMRGNGLTTYGKDISLQTLFVTPFTTGYQFSNNISLWFIFQLFIIEMIANIIYIFIKQSSQKLWDFTLLAVSFAVSLYCCKTAKLHIPNDFRLLLSRTGFMYFFFQLGIVYQRYIRPLIAKIRRPLLWCGVIALAQTIGLNLTKWNISFNARGMSLNDTTIFFSPFITSITASLFLILLARALSWWIERSSLLRFVGSNIRYIVYHHQMCCILLNCFALLLHAAGETQLTAKFDPAAFQSTNWYKFYWGSSTALGCLPYLLVGVFVPLLLGYFINKCSNRYVRFVLWMVVFGVTISILAFVGNYVAVHPPIPSAAK